MKQLLSLAFAAFLMASCQSGTENNETTTTQEPANTESAKPTVNPAHGQPYHDCSIPVGAPLAAK